MFIDYHAPSGRLHSRLHSPTLTDRHAQPRKQAQLLATSCRHRRCPPQLSGSPWHRSGRGNGTFSMRPRAAICASQVTMRCAAMRCDAMRYPIRQCVCASSRSSHTRSPASTCHPHLHLPPMPRPALRCRLHASARLPARHLSQLDDLRNIGP